MLTEVIYFRNVLVKGGDLPASLDAVDVLYDGNVSQPSCSEFHEFAQT